METIVSVLVQYIGQYTPVLTDVLDAEGNVIGQVVADGLAGVDWPWIASAVLLLLSLYYFGRVAYGAIFGGGRR